MKVEVAVLGPDSPYGLCGRKVTLNVNLPTTGLCVPAVGVELVLLGKGSCAVCLR